jgi:pyruvate-formate lyase-activating enzyme
VAFTYNDPVIFAEYAHRHGGACRARDQTVAVTAGYIHAARRASSSPGWTPPTST